MTIEQRPKGLGSPSPEGYGGNVTIDLQLQRHGIRSGLYLTDTGRDITRAAAEAGGKKVVDSPTGEGEYHASKAVGSSSGTPEATKENPHPMGRALETAHITAGVVAGERAGEWHSRVEDRLNYETAKIPPPYDHLGIYNPALARVLAAHGKEKPEDCTADELAQITQEVQIEVIRHLDGLNTPEAIAFKKETAGMFADLVEHYTEMAKRLKSNSRVAYTLGTHGGTIEHLIQQAAVWKDPEGKEHVGFDSIEAFGGGFDSSEAYTIRIETDENKNLKDLTFTFANPNRPQGPMHLHMETLHELAAFYRDVEKTYNEAYARRAIELADMEGREMTKEEKAKEKAEIEKVAQTAALARGIELG